jgi:2-oxoglutarate ferredoxin oxidoreductase subunit beta
MQVSIGFGQFAHAIRRNVNMLYICENNGVYGLTKGQFSASADVGSRTKKGEENLQAPVDPVLAALSLGGTFIARSFSGDRAQLVPLIKAGLMHKGFALIDVISPCVTFNDHEGSTKSYAFTREHYIEAVAADYIAPQREISVSYGEGEAVPVDMHDGSRIVLRKLDKDYDPTHRGKAFNYLRAKLREGEHVTGLIYVSSSGPDMHAMARTSDVPLNAVPYEKLHPGSAGLAKVIKRYA